jgi:hypothetical protein
LDTVRSDRFEGRLLRSFQTALETPGKSHEDHCRIRKGHAAENLSVLCHIALNLLKHEQSLKAGVKTKRLKSAWDDRYRANVLSLA